SAVLIIAAVQLPDRQRRHGVRIAWQDAARIGGYIGAGIEHRVPHDQTGAGVTIGLWEDGGVGVDVAVDQNGTAIHPPVVRVEFLGAIVTATMEEASPLSRVTRSRVRLPPPLDRTSMRAALAAPRLDDSRPSTPR